MLSDAQTFVDEIAKGVEQKSWVPKSAAERKKQSGGKEKAKPQTRPTEQQTTAPPTAPKAANAARAAGPRLWKSTLVPDAPVFVPRDQAVTGSSAGGPAASWSNKASIPTGPRADRINGQQQSHAHPGKAINGQQNQPKKRKLHERDTSQSRNSGSERTADHSTGERPHKQVARRGGVTVGRSGPRVNAPATTIVAPGFSANAAPFESFFGQPSATLPEFPSLDPTNPFGFLANMSAMMSTLYSGQAFGAQVPNLPKAKCVDYETKGICKLGTFCPYDHGTGVVVPADPQYDPSNSSLAMIHATDRVTTNGSNGNSFVSQNCDRIRATFSQSGPSRGLDDTVVVEQIPEDRFTEQHVRDFFSQFGAIVEVQMHAYKRLAIVKFSDHPAAQRAYDSPKVIFDNRFVKLYWFKPEHLPQSNRTNGTVPQATAQDEIPKIYNEDTDMVEIEEIKLKQAQAQKEFVDRKKKADEAAARTNMLNAQANAKEEEAKRLRARVMELERAKGVEAINQKEQRAYVNDLARLQSEAAELFANAGSTAPSNAGRGNFISDRGSSFRGGSRGRGSALGGRGGVVRLDNRPRHLAVAGIEAGSAKERALKQHLLNVKGCTSVYPHAEHAHTLVVGFDQRYQAEMVSIRLSPSQDSTDSYQFLNEAPRIPNISMTDLSWIANDDAAVQQSIEFDERAELKHDEDEEMSDGQIEPKTELDLDVADDEDQWL